MAQLQTVSDIQTEFLIRNNRSTTDAFITDTTLNNWLQESHVEASAYKKWPMTEGRVSTTFASLAIDEDGVTYGQYPEGWKRDTIRLMQIGGKRLEKKNFYEFKKYLEDNPSTQDKIFTDFNGLYYINANAGLSGTVAVWGQYSPALDATDKTAVTIFTYAEEQANEAILDMMTARLKRREHQANEAEYYEGRAHARLDALWQRIAGDQFDYQTTPSDGMFKRMDIVRGAMRDDTFKRDQFL